MKRISFLVFSIILIIAGTDAQGRNELKFNLAKSAFSFPELSYEYVLNKNMSIGSALGVGVNPENYLGYKYMFLPNYRWFFAGSGLSSHKNASGFFLEANAAIFSQNSYTQEGEFAIYPGESIYDGYGHLIGSNNQVIDTRHDVILNTSGYGLGAAGRGRDRGF